MSWTRSLVSARSLAVVGVLAALVDRRSPGPASAPRGGSARRSPWGSRSCAWAAWPRRPSPSATPRQEVESAGTSSSRARASPRSRAAAWQQLRGLLPLRPLAGGVGELRARADHRRRGRQLPARLPAARGDRLAALLPAQPRVPGAVADGHRGAPAARRRIRGRARGSDARASTSGAWPAAPPGRRCWDSSTGWSTARSTGSWEFAGLGRPRHRHARDRDRGGSDRTEGKAGVRLPGGRGRRWGPAGARDALGRWPSRFRGLPSETCASAREISCVRTPRWRSRSSTARPISTPSRPPPTRRRRSCYMRAGASTAPAPSCAKRIERDDARLLRLAAAWRDRVRGDAAGGRAPQPSACPCSCPPTTALWLRCCERCARGGWSARSASTGLCCAKSTSAWDPARMSRSHRSRRLKTGVLGQTESAQCGVRPLGVAPYVCTDARRFAGLWYPW